MLKIVNSFKQISYKIIRASRIYEWQLFAIVGERLGIHSIR